MVVSAHHEGAQWNSREADIQDLFLLGQRYIDFQLKMCEQSCCVDFHASILKKRDGRIDVADHFGKCPAGRWDLERGFTDFNRAADRTILTGEPNPLRTFYCQCQV